MAWLSLLGNALGLIDMARFGQLCFWCTLTAALAVPIVWLARRVP